MTLDNMHSLRQQADLTDASQRYVESDQDDRIDHELVTESSDEPLATTLAAVVSGGVAGAAIGHLVAGRMGSTIGAVVGGVAGAAISKDGAASHAVNNLVETIKDAPDHLKAIAVDRRHNALEADTFDNDAATNYQSYADELHPFVAEAPAPVMIPDRVTLLDPVSEDLTAKSQRFRYVLPAKTHFHMGVALGRQGHIEDAIEEFRRVLTLAPTSAETNYNLGIAFTKRGNLKQALKYLRQASQLCLQQGKLRGAQMVEQVISSLDSDYTQLQY